MFILCCRIVFSLVFIALLLWITGRLSVMKETLQNRTAMLWLIPAAALIAVNWWAYIYAVTSGHVLDSSLGYYMNPLVVFITGTLLFREKSSRLQIAAVVFAAVGVVISVVAYGSVPYIALILAFTFAAYGACKKKAAIDPVAGIGVEALLLTPFAIAYALIFKWDSIVALSLTETLILIPVGVVSSVPLILYSKGVNEVPFVVVGFLQYISPSLMLVFGLLTGETMTPARIVSFVFIGVGLALYSIGVVRQLRRERAAA